MTAVRFVVQSNPAGAGNVDHPDLVAYSRSLRESPGCLQAEDFRGTEYPEDLLHIELWESAAAFDAHWQRTVQSGHGGMLAQLDSLQSPHHFGTPASPRRTGQNGVELYEHRYFARYDQIWGRADESERSASVRWPAWAQVRILIQGTSDPNADHSAQLENSRLTREEPGCEQFEHFRGLEYPENTVLMETWTSPEIYDRHWLNRLLQQAAAAASGSGPVNPPAVERRYGRPGPEWYNLCYYTLVDNVWLPEDPARRMVTVRW